jgi:DNA-binding NarL/FixJ family response regulator
MDKSRISLVIADDHPLILAGIAALIEGEPELELLGQAVDTGQAVAQYERLRPDVLLIDLNMPGGGGLEAIARSRARHPGARIVILTTYEGDEDVHRALEAGKSNKLIARDAGIGVGTVKFHVNNILSKLDVSCRTEAASVARQRGLLHPF